MSSARLHTAPGAAGGQDRPGADRRRTEMVRAVFLSLAKYINAKTIYAENSPMVAKFGEAFQKSLAAFFQNEKELVLAVEQYQITWRGEVVYDNREKKESLAFLLYKDGVGEVTLHAAARADELERFVDLIKNEILNPSVQGDIVSKLWQTDFTNISYRVFDEVADGKPGEGRGSGAESGEQKLRLNDHEDLSEDESGPHGNSAMIARSTESLGQHLHAIIERRHPDARGLDRERHMQDLLESLFTVRADELQPWRQSFGALKERDKLLWLLHSMLDFTRTSNSAPVVRDVLDIIHRLIRSIADEAHIPSLVSLLEIQKKLAAVDDPAPGFESLPQQIRHELTNTSFLLSLGKKVGRSRKNTQEILDYFRLIGNNAVPALRGILASSGDASIHAQVCDALIAIARDYIMPIVEDLRTDNPLEAQDAIYLLRRCATSEVPAVMERYLASPDARVRVGAAEYLALIQTDEAAQLLCRLLGDADKDVRIGALAAVENLKAPSIVAKVTSMCFEEDLSGKGMDETERLFRTIGKLAGADVLPQIKRMASPRGLFSIGGGGKQNKLLAITALRFIPGDESRATLSKMSGDRDKLVRSMATRALNVLEEHGGASDAEAAPVAAGGTNDE